MISFSKKIINVNRCVIRKFHEFQSAYKHKDYFVNLLGRNNVLDNEFDMQPYTNDWTKAYSGGSLVCFPHTTEDVSAILRYCNENRIGVVPQGGNTGLVGGGVGTNRKELILSLSRMNKILSLDSNSATITCEAGCILENLDNEAQKHGFVMPLDLGAKGTCMIGGNISTNAGGLRVIKFGSMHANVLGLEVVLADGTRVDMLRNLYKDNSGYHLKHWFIGSEGTLGIITKACIRLPVKPRTQHVVFTKVSSFDQISRLLTSVRSLLGSNLSAFEFMDGPSLVSVNSFAGHLLSKLQPTVIPKNLLDSKQVLTSGLPGEMSVLIESSGSDENGDHKRLEECLSQLLESEIIEDAALSQDITQTTALWNIRETVPVSIMQSSRQIIKINDNFELIGKLYKYDISLELNKVTTFLEALKLELLSEGFVIHLPPKTPLTLNQAKELISSLNNTQPILEFYNFGHAADLNLHLNIICRRIANIQESSTERLATWEKFYSILNKHIYTLTLQEKGSVSAEHGVGVQKKITLLQAKSKEELLLMRNIKNLLDPHGILNPGKVLISSIDNS